MGIEELIGRLDRDADARIADAEARAKSEVEAIVAGASRASSRATDEALAARRAERRARLERENAEARRRARTDALRAEHALVARALARASELLDGMDADDASLAALPERVAGALRFFEGRAAKVRCRPALAPAMRGAIAGREGVTVEEVPAMPAGFTVVALDGSVEVDDTLPARLATLRPRLAIELLAEVAR